MCFSSKVRMSPASLLVMTPKKSYSRTRCTSRVPQTFEHQRAVNKHRITSNPIASIGFAARRSAAPAFPTGCCYTTFIASIIAVVEVPVSMPLSRGRHLLHSSRSSIAPRGRRARRAPLLAQTHFLVCCAFNAMCDATFYVVAKFHVISAIVR